MQSVRALGTAVTYKYFLGMMGLTDVNEGPGMQVSW